MNDERNTELTPMRKSATLHFEDYRTQFPPRPADLSKSSERILHSDKPYETQDLCSDPEVSALQEAPQNAAHYTTADPEVADNSDTKWLTQDKSNLYLWLVRSDDVKICPENGVLGQSTQRERLSHTNLSGPAPAHCGGELWFRDAGSLYLNGGSSRFTARNRAEWEAIEAAFRVSGYKVCSFGWNEEIGKPKRTLRKGEIEWL